MPPRMGAWQPERLLYRAVSLLGYLGRCRARRQAALGQNFDCPIQRNTHDALRRVHPGIAVQQFVFLGADGLEIHNWSLLQLRFGEEFGWLHRIGDTGFLARLEKLQQAEKQHDGDDAYDDQTDGEFADRPDVDVRGFVASVGSIGVLSLVHVPKPRSEEHTSEFQS